MQIKIAASLLACLAITGSSDSLEFLGQPNQLDALAKLLLVHKQNAAFNPSGPLATPEGLAANRRAAITTAASALAAAALLPHAALADEETDRIVAEIAARNKAEVQRKREEEAALYGQEVEPISTEDKVKGIGGIGLLGLALSVPFYLQNLKRVSYKVASGGKSSGYEEAGGPSFGEKLVNQVAMSAFKIDLKKKK